MKKLISLLLLTLAPMVAAGSEFRFFDLFVESGFAETETTNPQERAEKLIASIDGENVILKSFAIVPADSDSPIRFEQTRTLQIPQAFGRERGRIPQQDHKVGLVILIEEMGRQTKISYSWSEVDRWIPFGDYEATFVPQTSVISSNMIQDFSKGRFIISGGLDGEGPQRLLVIEKAVEQGDAGNGVKTRRQSGSHGRRPRS